MTLFQELTATKSTDVCRHCESEVVYDVETDLYYAKDDSWECTNAPFMFGTLPGPHEAE